MAETSGYPPAGDPNPHNPPPPPAGGAPPPFPGGPHYPQPQPGGPPQGGGGRSANTPVLVVLGVLVIAAVIGAAVIMLSGDDDDESQTSGDATSQEQADSAQGDTGTDTDAATEADPAAPAAESMEPGTPAPGGNESDECTSPVVTCTELANSCSTGDLDDCDQLFYTSTTGSAWEEYGATCGGRAPDDSSRGRCYEGVD